MSSTLEATALAAESVPFPVPASVSPVVAWSLVSNGAALLVDVRTPEELKFVG